MNSVFRILTKVLKKHMGGCQNYGPFFDPYLIFRIPKKDHNFDYNPNVQRQGHKGLQFSVGVLHGSSDFTDKKI